MRNTEIAMFVSAVFIWVGCDSSRPEDAGAAVDDADAAIDPQTEALDSVGEPSDVLCPTAVIDAEQTTMRLSERLQLNGTRSFGASGRLVQFSWRMTDESGAEADANFLPSSEAASVTVSPATIGIFIVTLSVVDESGSVSCIPASLVLRVVGQ